MDNIGGRGLKIETVEDRSVIPLVMEWSEFRAIEETSAAGSINGEEVTETFVADAVRDVAADGSEGPIQSFHAAELTHCAEAGAGRNLIHEARFVAKLGYRCAGNELHALNGAGGELGREYLALLVADGLAINDEGDLGVVA